MALLGNKEVENLKSQVDELKKQKEVIKLLEEQNENLKKLLEIAQTFETAEKCRMFLEKYKSVNNVMHLIQNVSDDSEKDVVRSVEQIVLKVQNSFIKTTVPEMINLQTSLKDSDILQTIKLQGEMAEQKLLSIEDEFKKQQEKEETERKQLDCEKRFGKELFTDEDIMRYGNTPGNIANGGEYCEHLNSIWIEFKVVQWNIIRSHDKLLTSMVK